MTVFGVAAGATSPYQLFDTNPFTPASAMVGTEGRVADRFIVVTPRALNLPPWICGTAVTPLEKEMSTSPPRIAVISDPPLLYGTWRIFVPVNMANISP